MFLVQVFTLLLSFGQELLRRPPFLPIIFRTVMPVISPSLHEVHGAEDRHVAPPSQAVKMVAVTVDMHPISRTSPTYRTSVRSKCPRALMTMFS